MKNTVQKILIVDDDIDLCFLLNHFLSRKGYLVTERYTGSCALKFLETEHTDLVLSDLKLDDTDGITLLNSIKALHPQLPVIIITGFTDTSTSEMALKQGAFKYISKPLLPDHVLTVIQQALTEKAKLEPL